MTEEGYFLGNCRADPDINYFGSGLFGEERTIKSKAPRQIRKWTCHKLEAFSDYLKAYAPVTRKADYCYIELYAGRGNGTCNGTDCYIEGSELRALASKCRFARYIFVAKSQADADRLRQVIAPHAPEDKVAIVKGNCNSKKVIRQVLDSIPRSASSFAFINPSGYQKVHWSTIELLASRSLSWQREKMELLIMFPLEMALFRNLMRPQCQASITRFYGSQRWDEIRLLKQAGNTDMDGLKLRLVELFKEGLKGLGYKYVEDFKPASPSRQPYYHLISASDSGTRVKMLKNAWGKPRYLRCELLYKSESKRKD